MNKIVDIKLNSICKGGIGHGTGSELVPTLYAFLLSQNDQHYYTKITILQIDQSDVERIDEISKRHGFVRLIQDVPNFDALSIEEKNKVRLDILASGLLRLAKKDNRLDIDVLKKIYTEVVQKKFEFEFVFKTVTSKSQKIKASLSVVPGFNTFGYYMTIEKENKVLCKRLIYIGVADFYYYKYVFNKFVLRENYASIFDEYKQAEIRVNFEQCIVQTINHTIYKNPPEFTFWRGDITKEERTYAQLDQNDFLSNMIE